ncbi:MAG: cold shock domain-containing protein [Gaiellaceae bacterium]
MEGTMLWFNADKGFGFIRTEDDERLYVELSGFAPAGSPRGRCAGRTVTFERQAGDRESCAVNVAFPPPAQPRRARLHHAQRSGRL